MKYELKVTDNSTGKIVDKVTSESPCVIGVYHFVKEIIGMGKSVELIVNSEGEEQ